MAQSARPAFLLVEPEPGEALSTRKLVLETAKFNVLTAHSQAEGIELYHKFPNVHAVVVHADLLGAEAFAAHIRSKRPPGLPIILLQSHEEGHQIAAEFRVSSHTPEALVTLLRSEFGDPSLTEE